jgi:hypothetical protein
VPSQRQRKHSEARTRTFSTRKGKGTGHGKDAHCTFDVLIELLAYVATSKNEWYESKATKGKSQERASALSQFLYSWPMHGRPLGFVCEGVEILCFAGGAMDVEYLMESWRETAAGFYNDF